MSKQWYPVIDPQKCNGCMACYNKCKRGVYDIVDNFPKVANPEGCMDGCHGCGNLCPMQAISYYGEGNTMNNGCKSSVCGK